MDPPINISLKAQSPESTDIANWLGAFDWLEKAGLIIKVSIVNSGQLPFSAYAEDNVFKLYLFDVGLLGAMSQITPKMILDYDWGSYKGFFVENYVAQAFLARGKEQII